MWYCDGMGCVCMLPKIPLSIIPLPYHDGVSSHHTMCGLRTSNISSFCDGNVRGMIGIIGAGSDRRRMLVACCVPQHLRGRSASSAKDSHVLVEFVQYQLHFFAATTIFVGTPIELEAKSLSIHHGYSHWVFIPMKFKRANGGRWGSHGLFMALPWNPRTSRTLMTIVMGTTRAPREKRRGLSH